LVQLAQGDQLVRAVRQLRAVPLVQEARLVLGARLVRLVRRLQEDQLGPEHLGRPAFLRSSLPVLGRPEAQALLRYAY